MKKILITDKAHESLASGLRNAGFIADYQPGMTYEEVKLVLKNYQGIIVNSKVICNKEFLHNASHLKFIGRLGSGLDIFDLPEAAKLGIEIISSPEGNANAVGEHCLTVLLALLGKLIPAVRDVRAFNWNREANRGIELAGKTVGIVGFGNTGSAFAMKLRSMDVRICTYDKYRSDIGKEYPFVREYELDELLNLSDVVSLHLPLTKETRGMVDQEFLSHCKNGVIFLNTSRGEIVRSADLLELIESGHIAAAALDVLENEKIQSWSTEQKEIYSRLLGKENVLITPHIAGWTQESLLKIANVLLEKILKFYNR